jgi:hypothetical protein
MSWDLTLLWLLTFRHLLLVLELCLALTILLLRRRLVDDSLGLLLLVFALSFLSAIFSSLLSNLVAGSKRLAFVALLLSCHLHLLLLLLEKEVRLQLLLIHHVVLELLGLYLSLHLLELLLCALVWLRSLAFQTLLDLRHAAGLFL